MKKYVLGADIGGTTVKLGLFTTAGELLEKWEIPTDTEQSEKILSDVAESCKEKLRGKGVSPEECLGIGLGVPGPVRPDGSVDMCVNLGWQEKQVKKEMEELLGIPAAVGNDANVAALGEMWQGGGNGCENMVMVTLGTGVGGGIIVNGKVVSGAHGYGGEIGHLLMNPHETRKCNCGKTGCLEQYGSAPGLVRMVERALEDGETDTILKNGEVTAESIFRAARDGDAFAASMTEQFAEILGRGLSYLAGVTDPEVFVIGGGVSRAGEVLLEMLQRHYKAYVFGRQKETKFSLATLENDAGIYGCAKLMMG
ncbi:MAG: ROK family glucokinase [Eubacteriales bacterium]|nr:ROK family glucokinase [Eubacteriales bacterium]